MAIPPETLRDASLLLTDARGVLIRQLGPPGHAPWSVDCTLHPETLQQLSLSMRQLGADDALRRGLAAVLSTLDRLDGRRLFWFQSGYDEARTAIEQLDGLTRDIDRRLAEAAQDGWRPLEPADDARSRLDRSTRRVSSTRNISAG